MLAAFGLAVMRIAMRIWGGLPIEALNGSEPMTAQRGIVFVLLFVALLMIVVTLNIFKK